MNYDLGKYTSTLTTPFITSSSSRWTYFAPRNRVIYAGNDQGGSPIPVATANIPNEETYSSYLTTPQRSFYESQSIPPPDIEGLH